MAAPQSPLLTHVWRRERDRPGRAGSKRGCLPRFDPCGAPAAVQTAAAVCRTGAAPQGSLLAPLTIRHEKGPARGPFSCLAEREGFEPSIPFGIHTFQACSFDHSDISPDSLVFSPSISCNYFARQSFTPVTFDQREKIARRRNCSGNPRPRPFGAPCGRPKSHCTRMYRCREAHGCAGAASRRFCRTLDTFRYTHFPGVLVARSVLRLAPPADLRGQRFALSKFAPGKFVDHSDISPDKGAKPT